MRRIAFRLGPNPADRVDLAIEARDDRVGTINVDCRPGGARSTVDSERHTLVFTINHVKTVRNKCGFYVNLVRASRSKIDVKTVRRSRSSDDGFSQGFYIIFRGYVDDDTIDHVTNDVYPAYSDSAVFY